MPHSTARRPPRRLLIPLLVSACAASGWSAGALATGAFSVDSPWMTGDWGGLRTAWLNQGVDIQMGYTGESATSLHGGYNRHDRATRYADQFNLGANIDLQKLLDWDNTAFSISLTNRNGDNINDKLSDPRATGLGSTQEIQGRGSATRLSELWLSKGWLGDTLNIKAGRLAVSDDFAVEDCSFQGLAFCGSQPGNYVDSIYNGPISQWAVRVRYRLTPELYAQIGAFNINPSGLENDNGFKLNGAGTTGTLVPVEVVWAPTVNQLPGEYRIGYYHSSANGTDVYKDRNNLPAAVTGNGYRSDASRHGFWLVGKQQLTQVNGNTARGLTLTASATFQDRATTPVDSYQKASLVYKGPFAARPTDTLGFGVARVHASSLFLRNAKAANAQSGLGYDNTGYVPEQHTEYVSELNYGIQATRWLNVMPNLQYIKHPDGVREVDNALVLGVQVQSQF
ncbi:carbohydrate porin [Pseudomonas typographi]|uniref:Porin n=1 Tax=Pseudomonas typographi TaxID=2715964 RepID=A0ABR7ZA92_9PSED|nr:carbohydrate porin [Pseudomonas typographi]MBD1551094.1 porin [Pseudomonas typographi]MBD1586412.1 porin [Pseudomonas typographi]MBD1602229.1 porin [Pseudomonas typographi]